MKHLFCLYVSVFVSLLGYIGKFVYGISIFCTFGNKSQNKFRRDLCLISGYVVGVFDDCWDILVTGYGVYIFCTFGISCKTNSGEMCV
jgi:hypothetical protein